MVKIKHSTGLVVFKSEVRGSMPFHFVFVQFVSRFRRRYSMLELDSNYFSRH